MRARAFGPAFPSKKLLWPADVYHTMAFLRSVDEDENCPPALTTRLGLCPHTTPPKLKWPTSDIDVGYHAAPAAYDVDGDGDFDLRRLATLLDGYHTTRTLARPKTAIRIYKLNPRARGHGRTGVS